MAIASVTKFSSPLPEPWLTEYGKSTCSVGLGEMNSS